MDWNAPLDGYCERLDASFWAEPVNAVTNAAFLLAALLMWMRAPQRICRVLSANLALIGIGSALFHTFATPWAALTDVLPIASFVFVYIWAANRHYVPLSPLMAAAMTFLAVPYMAVSGWAFSQLPGFTVSAAYWPVAFLIMLYGFFLRNRAPEVAKGLLLGAGILAASLAFRSLDVAFCAMIPVGTHFIWHLLNAIMLGWMIHVLYRHLTRAG